MGRHKFWGYAVDAMGNVIPNAEVSIYLAGTNTPAKVYASRDSTTPITEPPQVRANDEGYFKFWVDDSDYPPTQLFAIVITKNGALICKIPNVQIIRPYEHDRLMGLKPENVSPLYHLSEDQYAKLTQKQAASALHHHDSRYYTRSEVDEKLAALTFIALADTPPSYEGCGG